MHKFGSSCHGMDVTECSTSAGMSVHVRCAHLWVAITEVLTPSVVRSRIQQHQLLEGAQQKQLKLMAVNGLHTHNNEVTGKKINNRWLKCAIIDMLSFAW